MIEAFLWAGQQFYSFSLRKITFLGKYILSRSINTVSHIKKASKQNSLGAQNMGGGRERVRTFF